MTLVYRFLLSILCLSARAESSPLTYAIPRLENIYIDGNLQDWQERGFRVEALTGDDGHIDHPADLNVRFRLGWNSDGLLVLVVVTDDEIKESPRDTWLILADCVQFYLGNLESGYGAVRFDVAPGLDPDYPKLRYYSYDYNRTAPLAFESRSAKTQKGYIVEALLPWKNLGISPRRGREVGFQLHVVDGDSSSSGSRVHWHPLPMDVHYVDQARLNRLHLADTSGSTIRAAATASYDHYLNLHIGVTASPVLASQRVAVMDGEKLLAEGVLELQEGQAILALEVPRPQPGGR